MTESKKARAERLAKRIVVFEEIPKLDRTILDHFLKSLPKSRRQQYMTVNPARWSHYGNPVPVSVESLVLGLYHYFTMEEEGLLDDQETDS